MTPIRIGLVFNYDLHYCRCVLRGVKQYSLSKPHWVFLSTLAKLPAVTALRGLRLDGFVAQVLTHELAGALGRLNCPVVNVSRALNDLPFPRVGRRSRSRATRGPALPRPRFAALRVRGPSRVPLFRVARGGLPRNSGRSRLLPDVLSGLRRRAFWLPGGGRGR